MDKRELASASRSLCGVMVTYHPTGTMIANMREIFSQVKTLVVIDNGSGLDALAPLRAASQDLGFELIENRANLGIAEALNKGIRWAIGKGYDWVILFDQDSRISDKFIDQMFASLEVHPECERVAAMHPKYVDPITGTESRVPRAADGGPVTSMTSGALMPTWIFHRLGYFASELFIDQVDTEYGYRIRAAGYLNADSRDAILSHSPGDPKGVKLLGFTMKPTYHSAVRRYYMTRNRIIVFRKYFRIFPRFLLSAAYFDLRETVKCLVAEPHRWHKFRNCLIGAWDGLMGRTGQRADL